MVAGIWVYLSQETYREIKGEGGVAVWLQSLFSIKVKDISAQASIS